jgi:hypothetical protein
VTARLIASEKASTKKTGIKKGRRGKRRGEGNEGQRE